MITDIDVFIRYFHGQRRRTQWSIDVLPPEKALWTPWPGEPTPAEIICRIAAGHYMYATVVAHDYWHIDEYEQFATDWDNALDYFHTQTEVALDLLRPLKNKVLQAKRSKLEANIDTSAWRFLMAMLDHEITHRAQFNSYLMLLDLKQPRLDATSIEAIRGALKNGSS